MSKSLGLLEVVGLSTAISAGDVMVKTANVSLSDIEITRGYGYMTIKIKGDVAAVNASINAGKSFALKLNKFVGAKVIARPVPAVMEHLAADAHREVEKNTLLAKKETFTEETHENGEKQEDSESSSEEEEHESNDIIANRKLEKGSDRLSVEGLQEGDFSKETTSKEVISKAKKITKTSKKTKNTKNNSKK